jgi:hypothetical protein
MVLLGTTSRGKEVAMRPFLLGTALALALALAAATVRADEYRIAGPAGLSGYELGLVDGKTRLVPQNSQGSVDWVLEWVKGQGVLIRLGPESSGEKHSRWYLSYDVEGKNKEVFLREKPGPGSYWHVDPRGDHSTDAIAAIDSQGTEWFLDVGENAETVKVNEGYETSAYKAVLDRTSRSVPLFTFTRLSP